MRVTAGFGDKYRQYNLCSKYEAEALFDNNPCSQDIYTQSDSELAQTQMLTIQACRPNQLNLSLHANARHGQSSVICKLDDEFLTANQA